MSCLAAQIVAHFKKELGGIYLQPSGSRGFDEEFIYYLYPRSRENEITLCLRVLSVGLNENDKEVLFDGDILNAKAGLGL
jgi:hypothetical protein